MKYSITWRVSYHQIIAWKEELHDFGMASRIHIPCPIIWPCSHLHSKGSGIVQAGTVTVAFQFRMARKFLVNIRSNVLLQLNFFCIVPS